MIVKTCVTCGNDIPEASMRCRFCGSAQTAGRRPPGGKRKPVATVNVESGLPPVEEGLARLEEGLLRARHSGASLVRVIHGWGSGGTGGKLKKACRALLKQKISARQIKNFLPGEDYAGDSPAGRSLIGRYPDLKHSEHSDRHNPGITFVEI